MNYNFNIPAACPMCDKAFAMGDSFCVLSADLVTPIISLPVAENETQRLSMGPVSVQNVTITICPDCYNKISEHVDNLRDASQRRN